MNAIKHKHHHMKHTTLSLPNHHLTSITSNNKPAIRKLILPYHKIPFNKHKQNPFPTYDLDPLPGTFKASCSLRKNLQIRVL